jgi:hypothetical protein
LANLLPRTTSPKPFPGLDPEQCERFGDRLELLVEVLAAPEGLAQLERRLLTFEASLEELEAGTSLVTAHALLDGFDRARREIQGQRPAIDERTACGSALASPTPNASPNSRGGTPRGELLCYWPGRSLSTGESELASRGFFDVMDRPPLAYWLEAIARPTGAADVAFEVAILAWVPALEFGRAQAGRRACGNGSLALLREVSPGLVAQLMPMIDDR